MIERVPMLDGQDERFLEALVNYNTAVNRVVEAGRKARADVASLTAERDEALGKYRAIHRDCRGCDFAERLGGCCPAIRQAPEVPTVDVSTCCGAKLTPNPVSGDNPAVPSNEKAGHAAAGYWREGFRSGLLSAATIVEGYDAGLGTIGKHVAGLIRKEAEK
jgi:hypothetical protein